MEIPYHDIYRYIYIHTYKMLLFEFIWSMFGQFNLTESHDEDDDEG